ncbi:hypothetical protein PHET_00429 [Paragonimus heterotremus]|uniref:PDZ domain-containing protein n=1 Tax=Paragonimus heterotremus TaxID=100268 RepID=A0A8J4TSU4_9TREM|nr:hypothetical protein PHET_00429 [Paragonimus heterotremus]
MSASILEVRRVNRSDQLLVGDRILAIENLYKRECNLESVRSTKTVSGPWIRMEIEYELPDLPPAGCTVKHMLVDLETRGDGAGLVTRGGWSRLPSHIRPLTVMRVRENSMAELQSIFTARIFQFPNSKFLHPHYHSSDGRIKPGDRIVAINHVQTGRLTCEEAIKLIEASKTRLSLAIEYNVANFEADRSVSGAVMVEIEKPDNEDLGISLAPCHEVKTGQNAFFINFLRQGSIADRCGALFTGDRVEAIDDIHVEDLTLQEAMRRLKHNGLDRVRLQIVPNAISDPERQAKPGIARPKEQHKPSSQQHPRSQPPYPWTTSPGTQRTRSRPRTQRTAPATLDDSAACACDQSAGYMMMEFSPEQVADQFGSSWTAEMKQRSITKSLTSLHSARPELCRCEEVEVCLEPDEESMDYGLTLSTSGQGSTRDSQLIRFPIVDHVRPGSPAYKAGVIQEGDRVISMNGQTTLNRTIEDLTNEFLRPDPNVRHRHSLRLMLVTQYSVADTVVPSSGVFDVKLVRRAANLGINLQASIKKQDGQPLLISKVIPGSVASRSGSISPGDILLAVNGIYLSSCSLSEAIRLLQSPTEEIVMLRVQKIDAGLSNLRSDHVLVRSSPDASKVLGRPTRYRRSDSVPESDLNRPTSNSGELVYKPKSDGGSKPCEFELDRKTQGTDEPTRSSTVSVKATSSKVQLSNTTENQLLTDRSTSSGPEEARISVGRGSQKSSFQLSMSDHLLGPTSEDDGKKAMAAMTSAQKHILDDRHRLISNPEDLSQDEGVTIVRVVLKRKSADCPWGIIICGTDEAKNAPVFIDSLTPGEPGAMSGLLFSGDRILAINGSALHAGHTLTQAMRMLQRYPDRVVLHVARPTNVVDGPDRSPLTEGIERSKREVEMPDGLGTKTQPTTSDVMVGHEELEDTSERRGEFTRRTTLKKVAATSNFSRSFDSMTNSAGSETGCTMESERGQREKPQDLLTSTGIPLGSEGTRPHSTTSIRTLQSCSTGAAITVSSRVRTYSGIESTGKAMTLPSKYFGTDDFRRGIQRGMQEMRGQLVVDSNPVTPKLSPKSSASRIAQDLDVLYASKRDESSSHRESQSARADWMLSEHLSISSAASAENEGDTATDTVDHAEFFPAFTDYDGIDLHSIQCPGCREAIINEIRQQQQSRQRLRQRQQHPDQSPRGDYRHQVKRRTRSQQRSFATSRFESGVHPANDRGHVEDYTGRRRRIVEADSAKGRESPKATFFCPEQETIDSQDTYYYYYDDDEDQLNVAPTGDCNPVTRHSKSDSRLNLAGIADDEPALLHPDSKPLSKTIPTPTAMTETMAARISTKSELNASGRSKPISTKTGRKPTTSGYHEQYHQCEITETTADASSIDRPVFRAATIPGGSTKQRHPSPKRPNQPADPMISGLAVATRSNERGVWCTWIRLTKASPNDSYGIGVSEGLSTRGIFVSAIRPNSSADRSGQLHLYDRILMVNDRMVDGLSCSEVVGLISRAEKFLDLLVQRRIINRTRRQMRETTRDDQCIAGTSTGKQSITTMNKTNPSGNRSQKRVPHTNLTVL